MVWQGVPYPLENSDVILSLALKSIPKIVVDTPFSWETVLSAAIAGLIPAVIAYLAMHQNFKLANHQNRLQEKAEFSRLFRGAAAEHLTNLILLASAYETWKFNGDLKLSEGAKPQVPTEVSEAEKAAERSKNNLILLIEPLSDGFEIMQLLIKTQDKLRAYLSPGMITIERKNAFNYSTHEFINACHKYLEIKK
ncbi:Uncharacterised protein [Serratia marcescens]|uniref:hypothetical protein n=1 Tax=Serratia TaxID=613 RepID=UPI00074530D1|nr:hypothetical protein [Serratia marcescens]CUY34830.1 Uncharacterised protein [Serratia marcescens]CUY94017.1 Uncharacterised protein [Serratia marcescens]CUZ00922.1 Uncharacterised protein [Serratia marcescens]CVG25825.1 Uncharacterised protein [Serratia marcescens]